MKAYSITEKEQEKEIEKEESRIKFDKIKDMK